MAILSQNQELHQTCPKMKYLQEYPQLQELRWFLELTNYYLKFVQNFAKIAESLHKSTIHILFGQIKLKKSLKNSRTALPPHLSCNSHTLIGPSQYQQMLQSSNCAIGDVLCQEHEGQEHVVAYYSQQLSKAEWNYSTTEREALAVVLAKKEFYPYLYGQTFTLVMDSTSLAQLKDIEGRLSWWLMFYNSLTTPLCKRKVAHIQMLTTVMNSRKNQYYSPLFIAVWH